MNKAQALHRQAMDLADQAEIFRLKGDIPSEEAFLRQAFEKERAAALEISEQPELEPTRSVLLRSAASLALECQELQESERLAHLALSGHPPAEIASELRELLRSVHSATGEPANVPWHTRQEPQIELEGLVGDSPAMRKLFQQLRMAAQSDISILLEGETGTGKSHVARALHNSSRRAEKPFAAIHCGGLEKDLLEAELFGVHGGGRSRIGLFAAAEGGSLFLDEVGELDPALQAKLVRVLESREVLAVGASQARKVDVRILSATHRNLQSAVEEGNFREDLLYRLSVFVLRIPPLRDRRDDIPLLAEHFLQEALAQYQKDLRGLSDEALALLQQHTWTGNVRELRNEIERAALLTPEGEPIRPEALSSAVQSASRQDLPSSSEPAIEPSEYLQVLERQLIEEALRRFGWNVAAAAKALDLSRIGLTRRMERLGLRTKQRHGSADL